MCVYSEFDSASIIASDCVSQCSSILSESILSSQMFRSVGNVLISKCSHGEITMIIVWLIPDFDALLLSNFLRGCGEILWQQLTLLVEIVSGSL